MTRFSRPENWRPLATALAMTFVFLSMANAQRSSLAQDAAPLAILEGTDFTGGANQRYGRSFLGKSKVNYVYAQPNGPLSAMQALWTLDALPGAPQFLHLTAADDDAPAPCAIRIQLNGRTLFEGTSAFPRGDWETITFPIPADLFRQGENKLEIQNLEPRGTAGSPPWFMVTEAVIAPREFSRPAAPIRLVRSPGALPRQVGLSKVEITPRHPVLLSGFAGRPHELSLHVRQPLWARAIAVGADDESPAILIAIDNTGVPAAVRAAVLEDLQQQIEISEDRFTICSTHTHTGPMLTGVLENLPVRTLTPEERDAVDGYTQELVDRLVEAALNALRDRQPAFLHWGQGETGFAFNRRQGTATDPVTPVLVIADESGTPRGVMTNYACHCVSGGAEVEIHGDWAGCAAIDIEALVPGATAIVLVGCGGDQNPREVGSFEASQRQGAMLAEEVRRVLGQGLPTVEGELHTTFSTIDLPFAKVPGVEELQAESSRPGIDGFQARQLLARIESGEKLPESITHPIQTWQFGNSLAMVFLGGEVVVDFALTLQQEFDPARLWISAYSNDVACYIPTDELLKSKVYEAVDSMRWYGQPGPLAFGTQARVLEECRRQLAPPERWRHRSGGTGGTFPLTPEESISRMQVPEGFHVELIASEPLVVDPVAIDFAADGTLWVAEMRDYPDGVPGQAGPGGVIKLLQDLDQDGQYDHATTFLEGIPLPTGVAAWRNGVLICAAPDVLYAEDTDGDGQADVKEVVLSGFATHNAQARVNSLSWGLDNWMSGAAGLFGGMIQASDRPPIDASNRDFRFLPDQRMVQAVSGRTQQGRARDDWGNWFGCSSSELLVSYPLSEQYYARNPRGPMPSPNFTASRSRQLFPLGEIVGFALSGPPGKPTSACGLGFYRDTLLGEEFSNNSFTCEPVNQLVHRLQLHPDGSAWKGMRPETETKSEFLASSDNWFRPVQARTGPDGALWVVDMYRYVIEHPQFIPDDVKAKLNVRAGDDRGRIYRVVRSDSALRPIPNFRSLDTVQLVEQLDSPNGTIRDLAHQELLWRDDLSCVSTLRDLARDAALPQGRLHALCVLDGLGQLDNDFLLERLNDEDHPGVQRHLIRLSEPFLALHQNLPDAFSRLIQSSDAQVRLQLAYSLGASPSPRVAELLAELLQGAGKDLILESAALSSVNTNNVADVLAGLQAAQAPWTVRQPVLLIAAELATPDAVEQMLSAEFDLATEDSLTARLQALAVIRQIASRRQLVDRPRQLEFWASAARHARHLLDDDACPPNIQAAAIPIAVLDDASEAVVARLENSLRPHQPAVVQNAATQALLSLPGTAGVSVLFDALPAMSPGLQSAALDRILSERELTLSLLDRLESQQLSRTLLDLTRQQQLASHPHVEIQQRSRRLFSAPSNEEVAGQLAALRETDLTGGDREQGRLVFTTHCAACHQLEGIGHVVGPDLAALTTRSKDALLTSILDPGAAVDRRYANYAAQLLDGRVFTGVLASEADAAIALKEKGGVLREIMRADLEELRDSGKSMMPDGFGREIPLESLKDLLAFLNATDLERQPVPFNKPVDSAVPSVVAMAALVQEIAIGTPQEYEKIPAIFGVAIEAGKRNDANEIRAILDFSLPLLDAPLRDWEAVVIGGGVINGISQSGPWPGARIAEILSGHEELTVRWRRSLELSIKMSHATEVRSGTRYDALRMVAMLPFAESRDTLETFLNPQQQFDLVQGAVSGLADVPDEDAAVLLAIYYPSIPEPLRPFASGGLIRLLDDRNLLLDAVDSGKLKPEDVPAEIADFFRKHDNEPVREQTRRLLGE